MFYNISDLIQVHLKTLGSTIDNSQEEDSWYDDDEDESIGGLAGSFGRSVLLEGMENFLKVSTPTSLPSIFKGASIDITWDNLATSFFNAYTTVYLHINYLLENIRTYI
jgi:hypothetical protein